LSEAKARLLEDLKLLVDERSLCLVQKRALFALSLSKGPREHSILLTDHLGQNTKTRARRFWERRIACVSTRRAAGRSPLSSSRVAKLTSGSFS